MSWKKIKKMFPTGFIPNETNFPAEELAFSDYDKVNSYRIYYARQMIIKIVQHIWNKKGEHIQESTYDITSSNMPDNFSCLNVYGKKMLLDYKEKEKIPEDFKNDGFNYTGI